VSVIFHLNKDAFYDCSGGHLLHTYYIGLLATLSVSIFITIFVVYISTRGTIINTTPRRHIIIPIYLKFLIAFPELAWNIMGTYWAFGLSSGCDDEVIKTVKCVVISGWGVGIIVLIGLAVVFDPLGTVHRSKEEAAKSANRVWKARYILKYLYLFISLHF